MIYLDNSATTKIRKEALDTYVKLSTEDFGNPSSLHALGFEAEKLLRGAKDKILATLGDKGSEIVFTASGSEANNLAILGRAYSKERYKSGAKIITTAGEHASVNEPLAKLEKEGFKVVKIPTRGGAIDKEALDKELSRDVILVTVMMVNNETGALYDIPYISKRMKALCPDAFLHVDATQSYLKIPFTKKSLGADMITLSSHKIEGPKGVGALVIDKAVIKARGLAPIILGGGQESGLRSGTENVPAIGAFAEAAALGHKELSLHSECLLGLKNMLIEGLNGENFAEITVVKPEKWAPHIVNIILPKIKSETMLHFLSSEGVYVSSGSACSSNSQHAESALTSFGYSAEQADSSIRISLSPRNTNSDIDAFLIALDKGLKRLARVGK
jgi:cysteine desulfurase